MSRRLARWQKASNHIPTKHKALMPSKKKEVRNPHVKNNFKFIGKQPSSGKKLHRAGRECYRDMVGRCLVFELLRFLKTPHFKISPIDRWFTFFVSDSLQHSFTGNKDEPRVIYKSEWCRITAESNVEWRALNKSIINPKISDRCHYFKSCGKEKDNKKPEGLKTSGLRVTSH